MIRPLPALALVVLSAGAIVGACSAHAFFSSGDAVRVTQLAQREETRPLELAPGDTLTLHSTYGAIEVRASDDGKSELHATVRANGRTPAEAEAVLARYELCIERGPTGPSVQLVGEPLRTQEGSARLLLSAHVDYVALVPSATALHARTGSGDIHTRGALGSSQLATDYGGIAVDEIRGDLTARSGSGEVYALRVTGEEAVLQSDYGKVRLDAAEVRRITCTSGSGDLELSEARAESIVLETDYGAVHVRDASGDLRATSGSGNVRLHGVRGPIVAKSDYGSIEVEGELQRLEARTGSGAVVVRARPGSSPASGWALSSDYGEVVLHVPEGFACHLDARTDYGSIRCDFPVTIEGGKKERDRELHGTIGAGGPTVELTSGSGDVALKKL